MHRVVLEGEEVLILSHALPGALSGAHPLSVLSPAEREIARMIVEGGTTSTIAAQRGTSTRTVAKQLGTIYRRLGVSSRAELCVLCMGRSDT